MQPAYDSLRLRTPSPSSLRTSRSANSTYDQDLDEALDNRSSLHVPSRYSRPVNGGADPRDHRYAPPRPDYARRRQAYLRTTSNNSAQPLLDSADSTELVDMPIEHNVRYDRDHSMAASSNSIDPHLVHQGYYTGFGKPSSLFVFGKWFNASYVTL